MNEIKTNSRAWLPQAKAVTLVAALVWIAWAAAMILGDRWSVFRDGWFMSLTMVFGSFIAGSTSEGGGAVAFPVMTLVFDIAPRTARDFAWMIQAVGMNAAGATILLTGTPTVRKVIIPASLGGAAGVVFGLELVSGLLPPPVAKLLFTSVWLSFGAALWMINRRQDRALASEVPPLRELAPALVLASFAGGVISSITGSGLDICVFSLLVLRYRVSESVATPTSVVLMGINAAVGFLYKGAFAGGMEAEAWTWWWACIPVVVVGAPLGAWFIRNRSRHFVARLLMASIAIQYLGALLILPMSPGLALFSFATVAFGTLCFGGLAWLGRNAAEAAPRGPIPDGTSQHVLDGGL